MAKNSSLSQAKKAKKDEFYTQINDINNELKHYKKHFRGKTILCNCDDPRISNFFRYFAQSFEHLGLKRLITTCYKSQDIDLFSTEGCEKAVYLIYDGDKNKNGVVDLEEIEVKPLKGNGDFRSQECIELLKQADIVVTNPPFSLFREYVAQLIEYNKKFLILGNQNAISYKEIFQLFQNDIIWTGYYSGDMAFQVPNSYPEKETRYWEDETGQKWRSMGNICWYTNLDHDKRHEPLILYKKYDSCYQKFDEYNALNIDRIEEIPIDYYDLMGVPITFIDKYCPDQFEIIGLDRYVDDNPHYGHRFLLNGKEKYARILIRRKKE